MARINRYDQDVDVTKGDKLIGSDSGGTTKNFSLESVSTFFKETNSAGIVGQFVWQYKAATPTSGNILPTFSSGSTFANITSLKVNKYIKGETLNSIENILSLVSGKDVLLIDTSDQDNYGLFAVTSITQDGSTSNYDIALTYKNKSNGSLAIDNHYALVVFGGGADKNYASGSINTNDSRWSGSGPYVLAITHNLGKYGSPTVKDSANTIVHGKISYNALNTLQLTFNAKFVCEVFVN
jgi:hypothetical protein|tara:strand:+ start:341 stop:1057 length:717 start_codon:yes stop_codon:yes gene_type:complete